jgi:Spy/CpxP family protein refolding chaperone
MTWAIATERNKTMKQSKVWLGVGVGTVLLMGAVHLAAMAKEGLSDYAMMRLMAGMPVQHRMLEHISKELKLTDNQQGEIRSMLISEQPVALPLISDLSQDRKQLDLLAQQDTLGNTQLDQTAASTAHTAVQLLEEGALTKNKIYNNVLTTSQQSKAVQMQTNAEQRVQWIFDTTPGITRRLLPYFARRLQLTAEQQTKISGIVTEQQGEAHDQALQLADSWRTVNGITESSTFDGPAVHAELQKDEPVITSLIEEGVRTKSQIWSILTPIQRTKAKEFRSQLQNHVIEHFANMSNS